MEVQVQAHAVLVHRKAVSACHCAPLDLAPEGAPLEFTCRGCGQLTERVFGEPVEVEAHG